MRDAFVQPPGGNGIVTAFQAVREFLVGHGAEQGVFLSRPSNRRARFHVQLRIHSVPIKNLPQPAPAANDQCSMVDSQGVDLKSKSLPGRLIVFMPVFLIAGCGAMLRPCPGCGKW
jgi:hypothetical protein